VSYCQLSESRGARFRLRRTLRQQFINHLPDVEFHLIPQSAIPFATVERIS